MNFFGKQEIDSLAMLTTKTFPPFRLASHKVKTQKSHFQVSQQLNINMASNSSAALCFFCLIVPLSLPNRDMNRSMRTIPLQYLLLVSQSSKLRATSLGAFICAP